MEESGVPCCLPGAPTGGIFSCFIDRLCGFAILSYTKSYECEVDVECL